MPNIRIDRDVYEALQKGAEPFVDTPNTVLRRLLGLDPAAKDGAVEHSASKTRDGHGRTKSRAAATSSSEPAASGRPNTRKRAPGRTRGRRAPSHEILPESDYIGPLLQVLAEKGGSAHASEVVEEVGTRLGARLTSLDKERLPSGGIRWQNRMQFARLRLAEEGLIERNTRRGVWALTDAGMAKASEVA
jgi:hypothetical protein